jgi:two-component system chemotaxis sensor kinase CheA
VSQDERILQEFLLESHEHLGELDHDLLALERDPRAAAPLARAFRALHTLKGTCGFLGFVRLGALAHAGESLLARIRDGAAFDGTSAAALLATVDRVRALLATIERTGAEDAVDDAGLIDALARAARGRGTPASPADAWEPAAASGEPGSTLADARVRVDVQRLDRLMDLAGELVLARNQLLAADARALPEATQRVSVLTSRLQAEVMETRLQPVSGAWDRLPRLVRDVARACGREVRLVLEGGDTELDRSVLEAIRDPLVHLVRNAVDHGIETPDERVARGKPREGTLRIRASHAGGRVRIEVTDDGGGVAFERVKARAREHGLVAPEREAAMTEREWLELLFHPGFSTAAEVTDVSGRGVGLDVVRDRLAAVGGAIEMRTRAGSGTTIELRLPLTLAILPVLVLRSGAERYALPQSAVIEVARVPAEGHERIAGAEVSRRRGRLLPVVALGELLAVPDAEPRGGHLVVVHTGAHTYGVRVDAVADTQEVVVRPLDAAHRALTVFAGATVLGDGGVALILDPAGLARRARIGAAAPEPAPEPTPKPAPDEGWLVCTLRDGWHIGLPLARIVRIEELGRNAVEQLGDQLVTRWRGAMVPLVDLAGALDPAHPVSRLSRRRLTAVVTDGPGGAVGWMVDAVLDAARLGALPPPAVARSGVRGSAVLAGLAVDLVDVDALLAPGGRCARLVRGPAQDAA